MEKLLYVEISITLDKIRKSYFAHKIIWLYITGEYLISEQIDHIDGDGLNNCFSNLRIVNNQENSKNSRMSKNNTSGFNGVSWHKRDKKWYAHIRVDGELIYGGRYLNREDAINRRKELNLLYNFHELHGIIKKDLYF